MINLASQVGSIGVSGTNFAQNKSVTINGKTYPVIKVQDNDSKVKSFSPVYKEVVIIDGKQYDVQTVNDTMACDKTKQVVVVDGQEYNVGNGISPVRNLFKLDGGLTFNDMARINKESTICYNA